METFEFEDCSIKVELPTAYLTLGHFRTIKELARTLQSEGKVDAQGNVTDMDAEEWTYEIVNNLTGVDLNQVPLSPPNLEKIQKLCDHFTTLMVNSQKVGNDVVEEVEEKKDSSAVKAAPKKRGRPPKKKK